MISTITGVGFSYACSVQNWVIVVYAIYTLMSVLQLGVNSADKLHTVLSSSIEQEEKLAAKSSRTPASSSSQDELQKKPPVPKNQKEVSLMWLHICYIILFILV